MAVKHTGLETWFSGPEGRSARARVKAIHVSDIMRSGLAGMSLVLLAPLFLTICLVIKFTSRGQMFSRGLRVGDNGRIFTSYKFRTRHVDAEQKSAAQILADNGPSYTCVGKFLKRTKLDELPQLMNVFKGEMNFGGLRPTRPLFLEQPCDHSPCYSIRFFAVKPRMTGIA